MNIYSLLEHCTEREIFVHIVFAKQDPISTENQNRIQNVANHFKSNPIDFLVIDEKCFEDAGIARWRGSLASNYKFLVTELFPGLDKILYLDIDAFVVGDVSKIYDIPMDNSALMGVLDRNYSLLKNHHVVDSINFEALKIDPIFTDKYICIGIMMYNLKLIREMGISPNYLIDLHEKYNGKIDLIEQDIHNIVFRDHIKIIPESLGSNFHFNDRILRENLNQSEFCVVHGFDFSKPWLLPKFYSLGKIFHNYYDLCQKLNGDNGFKKANWASWKKMGWKKDKYLRILMPYFIVQLEEQRRLKAISS
jgi:lipopolysaccharide biosynthesis glycosyltransferase